LGSTGYLSDLACVCVNVREGLAFVRSGDVVEDETNVT